MLSLLEYKSRIWYFTIIVVTVVTVVTVVLVVSVVTVVTLVTVETEATGVTLVTVVTIKLLCPKEIYRKCVTIKKKLVPKRILWQLNCSHLKKKI